LTKMKLHLFLVVLATQISLSYGRVEFPERVYIEPGDSFTLTCNIPGEGVLIDRIYDPKVELPSGKELERESQNIPDERYAVEGAGTSVVSYDNASEEEHQGYYTCVAFRKTGFPRVETATGYIIVKDFCADANCPEGWTCEPDYVNYSHTCVAPPTTSTPVGNLVAEGFYPTCTIYPGGVIKSFDDASSFYDLACTHVLAADFAPEGDFLAPWFIYGTFDQHDGNYAMSHMTIFAGGVAFEFQRGWLVNVDGAKFEVEAGVPRALGDCSISFTGHHIVATCPHFTAYYDGVMAGHIQIGSDPVITPPVKEFNDIGLCWDNVSGFRPNWQVKTDAGCDVDPTKAPCAGGEECSGYSDQAAFDSCSQINCEELVATAVQTCSLNQADAMEGFLNGASGQPKLDSILGCPEEICDWQNDLLSRGCPQDNPPFDCA